MTIPRKIVLASRSSQLAQNQTNMVKDILSSAFPSKIFATEFMTTGGDHNQSQALYLLGGKALWTKELEVALKEGVVDILVHCFKDTPTSLPDGCEIAGVIEREDPVDSLIVKDGLPYKTLDDLPEGSVIGTSSVRRVAQLKRRYPKLIFKDVRGNLSTRLSKLNAPDSQYTAIVLAKAGLVRVGWGDRVTSDLPPPLLFYAVGQGALALEIRSDDTEARELCRAITHQPTEWRCAAERACLRVLEGGCSVPVGVSSEFVPDTEVLRIYGCVTSLDGRTHVQQETAGIVKSFKEAEEMGIRLAKILIEGGAKEILDEINEDRERRIGEAKTEDEKAKI
ncbi:porphobilinogen deaminase [Panus rudis PR-1116 ss-1]|nr:porphobilinogen deaminase [Panus rudis PR-1116 ss-1]